MAQLDVLRSGCTFDSPTLVEGFPGAGLVGKIATDHLVETFGMDHYANVHCEHLAPVTVYSADDPELKTPVRLYADVERDLLALQSDIPVSPPAALEFAECIVDWYHEYDATPIYLSGLSDERENETPTLNGIASGEGATLLDAADIEAPDEAGLVSGPTGALLSHAVENERTAVGLVVDADPQFPDPEAAQVLLDEGIEPLAGVEVPTEKLVERAEEISEAKQRLAEQVSEAREDSSQVRPLGMYQ